MTEHRDLGPVAGPPSHPSHLATASAPSWVSSHPGWGPSRPGWPSHRPPPYSAYELDESGREPAITSIFDVLAILRRR